MRTYLKQQTFYGYATGIFSSRQIEQATYENLHFRFIAGNLHPDHDTVEQLLELGALEDNGIPLSKEGSYLKEIVFALTTDN